MTSRKTAATTTLCPKAYREKMEKSITGRCLSKFWFVILASFIFSLLLVYSYNESLLVDKNNFFLLVKNSLNSAISTSPVLGVDRTGEVSGNYTEHVEQLVVIVENEKSSMNGSKIAENSDNLERGNEIVIAENETQSVERLPIEEKVDNSIDEVIVKKNGVREVHSLPILDNEIHPVAKQGNRENGVERGNETILAENKAQSVERLPIEENVENSIDEVIVKKNGVRKAHSLPILDNEIHPVAKQGSRENAVEVNSDTEESCAGRYIYVHQIPRKFNEDFLKHCETLSTWTDMCQFISNSGLGPHLSNKEKAFSNTGWFATNQFSLEVIFHNRMRQYKCLTKNSSLASAVFVPFYAGLDVARYLWNYNTTMRDSASLELVKWLRAKPEWKSMWGRDHFLVVGRISWDFLRYGHEDSDWGNNLMILPESKNMTLLSIESSPWSQNDFAIPYPTYFHPSSDDEVFQWQNRMRRLKRRFLYSFAGARRPNLNDSIRNEIIDQCRLSMRKCRLMECNDRGNRCYKPVNVMKMFQSSHFCLQPPGDSYTRRSAFDSILAGCIPVFFHPGSAYVQYLWHLPKNFTAYSVFIPMNDVKNNKVSIERVLSRFSKKKVMAMREEVIRLIPRVIYADPRSRLQTLEDAFDIAVQGVLERVEKARREVREGRNEGLDVPEKVSWKYKMFGTVEEHEWDPFF